MPPNPFAERFGMPQRPQSYPDAIIIGENIRQLRNQKGWTQVELAKQVGVRQTQINNYEHGASAPSIPVLKKLSELFGVSIDALVHKDAPSMEHISDRVLLECFIEADSLDYRSKFIIRELIEGQIAKAKLEGKLKKAS